MMKKYTSPRTKQFQGVQASLKTRKAWIVKLKLFFSSECCPWLGWSFFSSESQGNRSELKISLSFIKRIFYYTIWELNSCLSGFQGCPYALELFRYGTRVLFHPLLRWKHEELKLGKLKLAEKTWSPFHKPKSSQTLVTSPKPWKSHHINLSILQ